MVRTMYGLGEHVIVQVWIGQFWCSIVLKFIFKPDPLVKLWNKVVRNYIVYGFGFSWVQSNHNNPYLDYPDFVIFGSLDYLDYLWLYDSFVHVCYSLYFLFDNGNALSYHRIMEIVQFHWTNWDSVNSLWGLLNGINGMWKFLSRLWGNW